MSSDCPRCGSDSFKITDTNGASYPDPLIETRECLQCGEEYTEVLTA
jgi:transcriptional regulator NrdR family protein